MKSTFLCLDHLNTPLALFSAERMDTVSFPQRTLLLVLGVAVATSLLLGTGFVLGRDEPRQPSPTPAGISSAPELIASMRELTEALREFRSHALQPVEQSEISHDRSEAINTEGLATLMNDLSVAAENLRSIVSVISSTQSLGVTRNHPAIRDGQHADKNLFGRLYELEESAANREHQFWGPDDVLRTYGRPSDIYPSPVGGGIRWRYPCAEDKFITFWFLEDQVVKVLRE